MVPVATTGKYESFIGLQGTVWGLRGRRTFNMLFTTRSRIWMEVLIWYIVFGCSCFSRVFICSFVKRSLIILDQVSSCSTTDLRVIDMFIDGFSLRPCRDTSTSVVARSGSILPSFGVLRGRFVSSLTSECQRKIEITSPRRATRAAAKMTEQA